VLIAYLIINEKRTCAKLVQWTQLDFLIQYLAHKYLSQKCVYK